VLAAARQADACVKTMLVTGFGDIMNDIGELPPSVDKVLSKPVTISDLRRAIGDLLGSKT